MNYLIVISRRAGKTNGLPIHYGRLDLGPCGGEYAREVFADICARFPDHNVSLRRVDQSATTIAEQLDA